MVSFKTHIKCKRACQHPSLPVNGFFCTISNMRVNDSLTNLVTGLGTDRSKSYSNSYVRAVEDVNQYLLAYENSDLARTIVAQPAKDCFRKWREWQADPKQISLIEKTEKRIDVRGQLEKCKIEANLRGKAYLYISVKNDDPEQPLNLARVKKDMLDDVRVLTRNDISEGIIDTNPLSSTYGKPEYYEVASSDNMVRIHPSRIIVMLGREKPYNFMAGEDGNSVLKATLDDIMRHEATVDAVADLVQEACVDVVSVPGLSEIAADPDELNNLITRFGLMKQMKSNNRISLLNSSLSKEQNGEEWDQKQISFATLPDVIRQSQEELSAVAGIPRALLFGVSSGGLGSTGNLELSSYYDTVNSVQTNDIEPAIYVLDECIIRSALGSRPDDIWYKWASLWQISDAEKADIGDKIASKWQKLVKSGVFPADAVTGAVINDLTESGVGGGIEQAYSEWLNNGGMDELTEEDIENDINSATA